jgi:hypothetical protein
MFHPDFTSIFARLFSAMPLSVPYSPLVHGSYGGYDTTAGLFVTVDLFLKTEKSA